MQRCEIVHKTAGSSAASPSSAAAARVESVDDLNRLLSQQAIKAEPAGNNPSSTADGSKHDSPALPLDVPPNATIDIAYHLDFSDNVAALISAPVDPLVIDYSRVQLNDQPARVVSFFSRQMKGALEHPVQNGRWLDVVQRPTSGRLRSIDVIITLRPSDDDDIAPTNRNGSQDLIVEILAIETSDFLNEPPQRPLATSR